MSESKKKTNVKVIVLVVVTAIVFLLIGWFGSSVYASRQDAKAKETAAAFVGNIIAGQPGDSYALTTAGLQENQTQEEFEAAMSNLQSEDPRALDAQILKGDGKVLYIQYIENLPATSTGKTSGEFYITLEKDGRDWKVSNASVQ
jgi:hypothetical protein